MLLLLVLPAYASGSSPESTSRADKLFSLGLFRGTEKGYDLDATPTRIQGVIMLIRLLGKEKEALDGIWSHPFTDVEPWMDKYVGYAYSKGLSKGTSATTFSPNVGLSVKDYLTLLLRALRYDEAAGDFSWDSSVYDAGLIGLISFESVTWLSANFKLNRGDMVDMSYAALSKPLAGTSKTLAESLAEQGVFTRRQGEEQGVIGPGSNWEYSYTPYDANPVKYEKRTVGTSEGEVTADIVSVNMKSPRVKVKSAMVQGTIGATAPFETIVKNSGAVAVVNANFFEAYEGFKKPIGHVMVGGEFLYGVSGLTSMGITDIGEILWGRPAVFTRISSSEASWSAYEINSTSQAGYNSVLYTGAYGPEVAITEPGYVMFISGGKITGYYPVSEGMSVEIPNGGFVFYMGSEFVQTDYFRAPKVGSSVNIEYYLQRPDEEDFASLLYLESIVSGGPRLVKDGRMVYTLDEGFNEARFTTASTPRTAVGSTADGRLILVSVPSATIQQMRELMLGLGCTDALNLDGGGSTAMYFDGQYIRTPGRELTTTLQVFVD